MRNLTVYSAPVVICVILMSSCGVSSDCEQVIKKKEQKIEELQRELEDERLARQARETEQKVREDAYVETKKVSNYWMWTFVALAAFIFLVIGIYMGSNARKEWVTQNLCKREDSDERE